MSLLHSHFRIMSKLAEMGKVSENVSVISNARKSHGFEPMTFAVNNHHYKCLG